MDLARSSVRNPGGTQYSRTEIEVAVLGMIVPSIGAREIIPHREFYDYTAKYWKRELGWKSGQAHEAQVADSGICGTRVSLLGIARDGTCGFFLEKPSGGFS